MMNILALQERQNRDRYFSMVRKRFLNLVRKKCWSRPVFVFGKQRSGTSMLMYAFHLHPDFLVYDEHKNNAAFENFRLRDYETMQFVFNESKYPFVCLKPICDSHLAKEIMDYFGESRAIWIYRDFRDVANSSLRKFANPTTAIRLICTGQEGGGWLQEGVSPSMQSVLDDCYSEELSDFDLSCLVWWVRNQIVVESGLLASDRLTLIKYEAIAADPSSIFRALFNDLEAPYCDRVVRNIKAEFIGKNPTPPMNTKVKALCKALMSTLDSHFCQWLAKVPADVQAREMLR